MQDQQTTQLRKTFKILLPIVILLCFIAIFLMVYRNFAPNTQTGIKQVHVTVRDDQGKDTSYLLTTDAEFLKDVLDEIEPLSYSGEDSDYGIMVDTINGVTADYAKDGAYWAFYVNDEYCAYGVETQVVNDGDYFLIKYETN